MKKKFLRIVAILVILTGLNVQAQELEHNKTRSTKDIKILEPISSEDKEKIELTDPILGAPPKSVKESLGAGSTGGGQGKNGFLRDLESGPELVCRYKMDEFTSDMHTFQNLLNVIQKANAGFAAVLRNEIKKINLCAVMSELSPDVVTNQDGVIISASAYDQLAIRAQAGSGIDVYLANTEFNQMQTEEHQSFLLFHELLHSFTSREPEVSYINRLRSANAMFYEYYSTGKLNRENLEEVVEMYRLYNYSSPEMYLWEALVKGDANLMRQLESQVNLTLDDYQRHFYDLIENYNFNQNSLDFLIAKGVDYQASYMLGGYFSRTPMDIAVSSEKFKAMYYFNEIGVLFTKKHAEEIADQLNIMNLNDYTFLVVSELNRRGLLDRKLKIKMRGYISGSSFSRALGDANIGNKSNIQRHLEILK